MNQVPAARPVGPPVLALAQAVWANIRGSSRSFPARVSQHYAQCRYLCYYLQERGLLVRFYGEFTAHAQSDPSGEKSLKKILGTEDLGAVQKQWEKFVLGLRSP